jgi:hypothetical protein
MPTKRGAGGRQQNYDPRTGRFAKTNFALLFPPQPPTRKEKARKKEAQRRELLFHRAKNSRDPLVFDVFCAIEAELPGSVQFVNEYKFDPFLGRKREFDIITKKCIIEVKSGEVSRRLKQLKGQMNYAKSKNKHHVLYAPGIRLATKKDYEKHGITIKTTIKDLIQQIKENGR